MHRKISRLCLLTLLFALPAGAAGTGRWLTSVDEALTSAAKENRFVLVDLYAEWCGWCKVLEKDVFSSPELKAWAADFVLLRVDVDDGAGGSALQARFGAFSLPTTIVMDKHRVQVASVAGYARTAEFLSKLETEMATHRALVEYFEKMRAKPTDDPAHLQKLAEELHARGDGRRAVVVYELLRRHVEPGTPRAAWLAYRVADAYRLAALYDDALQATARARRLAEAAHAAVVGENVDILSYQIAEESGDCRGAINSLEHFLKVHPKSSHRSRARQTLDALRKDDLCV